MVEEQKKNSVGRKTVLVEDQQSSILELAFAKLKKTWCFFSGAIILQWSHGYNPPCTINQQLPGHWVGGANAALHFPGASGLVEGEEVIWLELLVALLVALLVVLLVVLSSVPHMAPLN